MVGMLTFSYSLAAKAKVALAALCPRTDCIPARDARTIALVKRGCSRASLNRLASAFHRIAVGELEIDAAAIAAWILVKRQ